jgi:hypothetical protein
MGHACIRVQISVLFLILQHTFTGMDPIILVPCILILIVLVLFLPLRGIRSIRLERPEGRFHEADAVLTRRLLEPGSEAYIPDGPRKQIDGVLRWQIDSEKCYQYWTLSGTDCGVCMSVFPYSHRSNPFHTFIRWGIKNNLVFRHLALKLDDVFYGRKPRERSLPRWVNM